MMSHMEQPTTNEPPAGLPDMPDYPRTPDGKYKYTGADGRPKYFPSETVPGLFDSQILPDWVHNWVRKLLTRAPKDA
jgi:hypothetical protein